MRTLIISSPSGRRTERNCSGVTVSRRLRYVDVATKAVTSVDHDAVREMHEYNWSPDSQWIAWARADERTMERIYLFSVAGNKRIEVTDGWYASGDPAFSDDGKYLMLVSARDFKPVFGQEQWENVYRDMTRVYLLTLAKATESPLAPRSDEVGQPPDDKKDKPDDKPKPDERKDDAAKKPVGGNRRRRGVEGPLDGVAHRPGRLWRFADGG